MPDAGRPRLLLLLPSTTYRAHAFVEAARRLDVTLTVASDHASVMADREPSGLVALDLGAPDRAAVAAAALARAQPVAAVFGVDDDTAVAAAAIAETLGLAHGSRSALEAARDKHRQRVLLRMAGVPVPDFSLHELDEDAEVVARGTPYPCVLKPLVLSASRGVIRADSAEEFLRAHTRLCRILAEPDVAARGEAARRYLVEAFVPGPEFALEGLMHGGHLHVLALFDKPDPLEGPFFEETIYVTPSRLPAPAQQVLIATAEAAAQAIGLARGPIHVELRYNERGPWLVELAGRPIGGRCGEVLRFGPGGGISLEEVVLAHALGRVPPVPERERAAVGVMMVPTPARGTLHEVRGLDAVRAVPGITGAVITVPPGRALVPLPEGSQYLGFIFARAEAPKTVERSLRRAHAALEIVVAQAD